MALVDDSLVLSMRYVESGLCRKNRLRSTRATIGAARHTAARYRPIPLLVVIGLVFASLFISGSAKAEQDEAQPWRLHAAAGAPTWLELGLVHRSRVELLEDDFRATAMGDVTALSLRTLIAAGIRWRAFRVGVEIQDSRVLITEDARVSTAIVNPVDVLRLYATYRGQNVVTTGDLMEVKLGRLTIDMGSRRFLVRNRYRNTINAFTGGDIQWTGASQINTRGFLVVPVTRQPDGIAALAGNDAELDRENFDTVFWGLYVTSPTLHENTWWEAYVLGLHESDGDVATRNRRIVTPGLRVYRKPRLGEVDFQIEVTAQLGSSRMSSRADDDADLCHQAFFVWAELGRTIDMAWQPRLVAHYDYASGDDDPNDGENGRFDSLFGAPIDLGPSGIYGLFTRSNLISPGGRAQVKPADNLSAFAAYRLFWLEEGRDAWVRSGGIRDPDGGSGRFLGQLFEARMRWSILPKNLLLDVGAAHFVRGSFARDAPGGRDAPSSIFFTQVTGTI